MPAYIKWAAMFRFRSGMIVVGPRYKLQRVGARTPNPLGLGTKLASWVDGQTTATAQYHTSLLVNPRMLSRPYRRP